jgi:hypothetical protein
VLASQPACPGDGNIDGVVDDLDLEDWQFYEQSTGLSSWYDLDFDGLTNDLDREIITDHLVTTCPER